METIKCKCYQGGFIEIPKEELKFRPSVYGIIIKGTDVLLLSGKNNKKLFFPGGGIEIGEKIENALKREVLEETGLTIKIGQFLNFKENFFYYEPLNHANHSFCFFYECLVSTGYLIDDALVDDIESEKPRWIPITDLKPDDFSDFGEDCLKMIQSLTKN